MRRSFYRFGLHGSSTGAAGRVGAVKNAGCSGACGKCLAYSLAALGTASPHGSVVAIEILIEGLAVEFIGHGVAGMSGVEVPRIAGNQIGGQPLLSDSIVAFTAFGCDFPACKR